MNVEARETRVEVRLEPVLRSAAEARARLGAALHAWHLDALAADVQLAVSELVTNAVLHARTAIVAAVVRVDTGVRLEVQDESTVALPAAAPVAASVILDDVLGSGELGDDLDALELALSTQSMSGRGLLVVASVADRWGVDVLSDGKTVWAEFGTGADTGQTWPAEPQPAPATPDEASLPRPVRLLAVPVRLALTSESNLEDLLRELQVLRIARPSEGATIPAQLIDLIVDLLEVAAPARRAVRDAAATAAAAGDRLLDIDLTLGPGAPLALWQIVGVLEQIMEFARSNVLLTLAPDDELVRFRRWLAAEIERQVRGGVPLPCPFPVIAQSDPVLRAALEDASELVRSRDGATARLSEVERRRALESLAVALTLVTDERQAVAETLERIIAALDPVDATVWLVDEDAVMARLAGTAGRPDAYLEHWTTFPTTADTPAAEAMRTGEPVFLRTRGEWDVRYPVLRERPTADHGSVAVLALRAEGVQPLGVLAAGFAEPRSFEEERSFLLAVSAQLANALARIRALATAERRRRNVQYLDDLDQALRGVEGVEEIGRVVADLAITRVSDWSSVHLASDPMRTVGVAHVVPAMRDLAWQLHERWPPEAMPNSGILRAARLGEPVLFQLVPDDLLAATALDDEHLAALRQLGFGSGFVVPMVAGTRIVGVLAGANQVGRIVSDDDYALAKGVAARAAGALAVAIAADPGR